MCGAEQALAAAANTGVASAIAAYMVWWVTRRLNGRLERVAEKLDTVLEREERILDALREILEREEKILDRLRD